MPISRRKLLETAGLLGISSIALGKDLRKDDIANRSGEPVRQVYSVRVQTDTETIFLKPTEPNDLRWTAQGIQVEVLPGPDFGRFDVYLSSPKVGIQKIVLTLALEIEKTAIVLGDDWERAYGDLSWRANGDQPKPWYVFAISGSSFHYLAVETGCRAMASWVVGDGQARLTLDVRSGARPVRLGNRRLHIGTVLSGSAAITESRSAFEIAEGFCGIMCPKPRLPKSPIYGVNDWYYAYGNNTAQGILDDSKRAADLAAGLVNRPFSVIDMGWDKNGGSGPWNELSPHFPDMAALAEDIRHAGCKPGLWFRPLYTNEKLSEGWFRKPRILDPSLPEVREKIAADIAMFRQWGYEFIKHDFSTFDMCDQWGFDFGDDPQPKDYSFHDDGKTTAEIALELYDAIRKASGSAIVLGCNTFGHLSAGHFETNRIGDDTSGKEWARTRKMGVNCLAFRGPQNRKFFLDDPDCVGLTKDIPWSLNKQWLNLVSNSGMACFVSAQKDAVGAEQKAALTAAFTVASRWNVTAEPLDWTSTSLPEKWLIGGKETTYDWSG